MSDIDFLSQLENQQHIQRCQALYDNATETLSKAADRLNSSQIDASEGRIQYFEKLTIGAGAVIAAIVSFVGSKPHTLSPSWVLRLSLIALVITLVAALWRNFRYPFYLLSARTVDWMEATLEKDKRKRELVKYSPGAMNIETGKPIDVEKWIADLEGEETRTLGAIKKMTGQRNRQRREWAYAERISLVSLLVSMVCLVCLAWWNF
jgi:hypothetical protein